jgi:hypothetical protein
VTEDPAETDTGAAWVRRHLRFGWAELLIFLLLGLVLEAMHGFKVGWYLNAGEETRRLLLTLAHAHGVLLGLVNLAFASTLRAMPGFDAGARRLASPLLLAASILMPAGFLLGGLVVYGGDPGVGIFLLAPGAALLAVAIAAIAWATFRAPRG